MIKQNRKLQGTFLDKRAYNTCVGIFETYGIPLLRVALQTRPATTSIPPAVPFEFCPPRPRPASAQDIMSRPAVPSTGHPSGTKKKVNTQTDRDSSAILAHSTLSQVWQPNDLQFQPPDQHVSISRHMPTSQPTRSNLSQLWQPDDPQPQTSSQNASSSRHTPTSQPAWVPSYSQPAAHLSQVWQPGNSQPGIHSQQASSSRYASESQRVCVPSSFQPQRLPQGSDKAFRNNQTGSDKAIDVPLAHNSSIVMDSMASSQASDGLNTQYLNYLPTSDVGFHSDATMIQSPEKEAPERHLQGAQGTPDNPQLQFPIESSDPLNKSASSLTNNQLPTSEYRPTIPQEGILEDLVANLPAAKGTNQKPSEPVKNAHEDELTRDVIGKGQGGQERAPPARRSKKARPVSKRTRTATQATHAAPPRSKIVILKTGKIEGKNNRVVPSSAPPVVSLKRSGTSLDDASATDASSHSSPTLPPKPAHVQDSSDGPKETRRPLQDAPTNGQSSSVLKSVDGEPEPNIEDRTHAARSMKDIHLSLDAFLSKNHQLLAPAPPLSPFNTFKEQMAHFGALPKEERTKVVDNLIIDALLDPGFEKLCQEVEGSWKRFAFEV